MGTSAPAREAWHIDLEPSLMPGITQLSMSTAITKFYPECTVLRDWTLLKKTPEGTGKT